jgi:serine protease AprX
MTSSHLIAVAVALAGAPAAAVRAGAVDPALREHLASRAVHEDVAVVVQLADRVDPSLIRGEDRRARARALVSALRQKASATQPPLRAHLYALGAREVRSLWAINALAATVRGDSIDAVARHPAVASVRLDAVVLAPDVDESSSAPRAVHRSARESSLAAVAAAPEWNLDAVHAPELWALGITGAGVVVAGMDTGVDPEHPDLAGKWRGGASDWFDPHGEHATPHDASGHGTQTMALVVGGAAGGTAIGMAPGARFIAVKLYDDAGTSSYGHIHEGFQWLLDPDGDPATPDAPDVVNASWGLAGTAGACIAEFDPDVTLLRAAGIAVAFAAGNDGPAPASSVSPANNPSAFAVGAVDGALAVAAFSSRGPSACGGGMFPHVVAPGVDVLTADLSFGGLPLYARVSGSSYAAPHVAGAMALLLGAFPGATVAGLEEALAKSALDLGIVGSDPDAGAGLVDVGAGHDLLASAAQPPAAADDAYQMVQGGELAVTAPGVLGNDRDADGDALRAALVSTPASGTLALDASGAFRYRPAATFVGPASFTYRAVDPGGAASNVATAAIVVLANRPPEAVRDRFSAPFREGLAYAAVRLPVLANDLDPDTALDPANTIAPATLTLTTAPSSGGRATVTRDGTVSYVPKIGFRGTETFTYRVRDTRGAMSLQAVVEVVVN